MFKRFLPLLVVILAVGFATRVQAQSCNGSMTVAIDGSSSGLPLTCTASVTSNYNGAEISCNPANTGNSSDGKIKVFPNGGTSPYTYAWTGGQTNQEATGLPAGTYIVTITDASGCTKTCQETLDNPPAIVAGTCSYVQDGCQLNLGEVRVEASGGTGSLEASWTATCSTPPGPQGPGGPSPVPVTFTGLAGSCTYMFVVTDDNGCTNP